MRAVTISIQRAPKKWEGLWKRPVEVNGSNCAITERLRLAGAASILMAGRWAVIAWI